MTNAAPSTPPAFELKAGMWLHASCADEWYGPILRVGKDVNGSDVIDLPIPDINEFLLCEHFGDFHKGECELPSIMRCEVPPGVTLVFRDLQYKLSPPGPCPGWQSVVLNTPGDGCYRCTQLMSVHAERKIDWEKIEAAKRSTA